MKCQSSRFVVGLVTLAALGAACDGVTDEGDPNSMENVLALPSPSGPLEFVVELPDEVAEGESIPMKMILRNTGGEAIEIVVGQHSHGPLLFNFWVFNPDGNYVTARDTGKAVAALPGPGHTLRPDDMLEFEWAWDQHNQDGKSVAPGTYQVIGTLAAGTLDGGPLDGGPPFRAEPVSVTIR